MQKKGKAEYFREKNDILLLFSSEMFSTETNIYFFNTDKGYNKTLIIF